MNVHMQLCAAFWLLACTLSSGQELQFSRRPIQVNDVAKQVVQCDLDAVRVIRQQNQLVDNSKQQLQRKQDRMLRILAVVAGKPTRARIDYGQSSTRIKGVDDEAAEVTQPVAGNTYYAALRGEQLLLSDSQGNKPTAEEEKILKLHLATFGKPNPLAKFLDGKCIRVGQSFEVPDEVARELLGLTGNSGKTGKLTLKLVGVQEAKRRNYGVFETLLRTSSRETSMTLLMKGQLVIEAATCRTKSIVLQGPVAISETRGPAQGRFVVSTNGTLKVSVETVFGQRQ